MKPLKLIGGPSLGNDCRTVSFGGFFLCVFPSFLPLNFRNLFFNWGYFKFLVVAKYYFISKPQEIGVPISDVKYFFKVGVKAFNWFV